MIDETKARGEAAPACALEKASSSTRLITCVSESFLLADFKYLKLIYIWHLGDSVLASSRYTVVSIGMESTETSFPPAVPFPIHPGSIMVENKPHTTEGNNPLCIFFIMFRRFSQKNDFSVYKYSITSRIAM